MSTIDNRPTGDKSDVNCFWQMVMDGQLTWIKRRLDESLAEHPELTEDSDAIDRFAMQVMPAVWRLYGAFNVIEAECVDEPDSDRRNPMWVDDGDLPF
jgi:hypothetical protein